MTSIRCNRCNVLKPRIPNNFRPNRRICRECERKESRERSFKLVRGITYAERDLLLQEQEGRCKCCSKETSGSKKGWHVDHCHTTGKIRGILCANCNIALGQVNDSVEHLEQLIDYIKETNE